MCGLTGAFTLQEDGFEHQEASIIHSLSLLATLRGVDGTGVLTGDINGDTLYSWKRAEPAQVAMSKSLTSNYAKDARWYAMHARAATVGGVTEEACHPFTFEHVLGMHNGTVHYIGDALPDSEGINDSERIYHQLNAVAPDEAPKVLRGIDYGAYALVWYDRRINSLRFVRNDERPLWFYKYLDTWYWHSEPGAIAYALSRHSGCVELYTAVEPWQLGTHRILTMPVDGSEATLLPYEANPYEPYSLGSGTWFGRAKDKIRSYYNRGGWTHYPDAYNEYWWEDDDVTDVTPISGAVKQHTDKEAGSNIDKALSKLDDEWDGITESNIDYKPVYATFTSPPELSGQQWLKPYIPTIEKQMWLMLGVDKAPCTMHEWDKALDKLAERIKYNNMDSPVVDDLFPREISFRALHLDRRYGLVYGAVEVQDYGWVPVSGLLTGEQQATMCRQFPGTLANSTMLPMMQGCVYNIRAYATGELGIGLSDLLMYGQCASSDVQGAEVGTGGLAAHPAILKRGHTYNTGSNWNIWKN